MYSSTSSDGGSGSSSSGTRSLLDCFPTPPTLYHQHQHQSQSQSQNQHQHQHQHVSFPMSDLRHSRPQPTVALAPTAIDIGAPCSTLATDFSSTSGALGLHIIPAQPSTSYSPPAVISLGEEWTDDDDDNHHTTSSEPSSPSSPDSSDRASSQDVFGDSDSYFAFSPSSSASSLSPELATEQLPLWQAEQARLVSIRDAVLSSERAARYREACLESELARIKDDLARVKEVRARARWLASRGDPPFRRNSAPDPTLHHAAHHQALTPLVRRASDPDVANLHRRAPVHDLPSTSPTSGSWFAFDDDNEDDDITIDEAPVPAESAGQFWDESFPDPEAMLANHLIETRTARAEERRKRRRDHERIRELGILLSLGSEVRQWEERLAWENAFRPNHPHPHPHPHPMDLDHLDQLDHADDPSFRRRSKSLPTTPPSGETGSSLSFPSSSSSPSSLTPPLPPLSASPLWRVSAEMILRRRSLSERPRRLTSVTAIPPPESAQVPVSTTTTAKRQALPPPISIPTSTPSGVASSLRSAPPRPSALKLSFTFEDLVAPEEAAVVEKIEEDAREDEEMCSSEESSEASDSDDSRCKSSSSNSSSSENEIEIESEKPLALRRGRSRWSWRKSLQSAQQLQQQLQQIVVDMEVDDA